LAKNQKVVFSNSEKQALLKKIKMSKPLVKPYGEGQSQSVNLISEGTKIKGDVLANGDIRIDGELYGNIAVKGRLVVGPNGRIEGQINCGNIETSGFIKGKITAAELLTLKATAQIVGDIIVGKLSVEPGSLFSGTCVMNGTKPEDEAN
jgi:cytoskeletal protein CcmA (bactofilin family)